MENILNHTTFMEEETEINEANEMATNRRSSFESCNTEITNPMEESNESRSIQGNNRQQEEDYVQENVGMKETQDLPTMNEENEGYKRNYHSNQQPYRKRSNDYDNNNSYRSGNNGGRSGSNRYNNNSYPIAGGYRGRGGYENNQGYYNNRYNNNNNNEYRYNNSGNGNRFNQNYNDRRSNPRTYNRSGNNDYQRQFSNGSSHDAYAGSLEPMDSYKTFIMKQDENLTPDLYQAKYEEYTKNYRLRAIQAFFDDHKKEEWLKERYSPLMRLAYQRKINEQKKFDMIDLYEKLKSKEVLVCLDEKSCFTDKNIIQSADAEDDAIAKENEISITVNNDMIPNEHVLYIRRIPCECPIPFLESSIKTALSSDGDSVENKEEKKECSFEALYLSDPCRKSSYDFDRSGWLVFDSAEKANIAMNKLSNLTIHEDGITSVPFRLQLMQNRPRAPIKLSSSMAIDERIEHDFIQAKQLAEILDRPLQEEAKLLRDEIGEKENINDEDSLENAYGIRQILEEPVINDIYPTTKMKLDVVIAYLRRVHYVIYYAGTVCRDRGDIMHTHPALFARPNEPTEKDIEDFNERKSKMNKEIEGEDKVTEPWSSYGTNLDNKIADIMKEYDWEKLRDESKRLNQCVEEINEKEAAELVLIYNEYVIKASDDSEKHRCGLCKKLFKAAEFVQKHIKNKHPELVEEKISKILEGYMIEEYKKDENRPMAFPNNQSVRLGNSSGYQGRFSRRGGRYDHNSGDYRHQSNYHSGDGYNGRGGYNGGRGGYHHGNTRYHDNYNNTKSIGQGQNQNQGQGRLPALLGSLPVDPRSVNTSYQDLDNLGVETKVDVNFATGLNNLPPPKKKQRMEEKEKEFQDE